MFLIPILAFLRRSAFSRGRERPEVGGRLVTLCFSGGGVGSFREAALKSVLTRTAFLRVDGAAGNLSDGDLTCLVAADPRLFNVLSCTSLGPGFPEQPLGPPTAQIAGHHLPRDMRVVARSILGECHHGYGLEKLVA